MRGSLTSRALSAAIVAGVVLLAAGGGYAVASSSSSRKITVCVHKHGHGLYTGKCAKHDKTLTWNKRGPQGPDATSLVFNEAGAATPTATTLGTAGPYSLSAVCVQSTPGTTVTRVLEAGPAATFDGFDMVGATPHSVSVAFPAHPTAAQLVSVTSATTAPETSYFHLLLLPASGTSVDVQITISATGGAMNTCHASVVIIPTS